ncbi:unnamed protein product [Durusdinium trenchii]|uniref:Pentatricopeptide repeat-containing protein, chloroplastic n=1 Tax=Durusdinium trenchii TaxID=1381693 RepID=A0ABP0NIJ6_9DINO
MAAAGPYKWAHLENIGDVYTPRTGHAVVNEDGVFYLFGGTDGAARQSDVHAYNVETNLWQEIRASGRAPPARSGAQAVVWNGNVWFFGGYTKKERKEQLKEGNHSQLWFKDASQYAPSTDLAAALQRVQSFPQGSVDYDAAVIACGRAVEWQWALQLLTWSRGTGCVRPPCNPAISACARAIQWQRAALLLRTMQQRGPQPSVITFGAVLDAFAKGAEWRRALHLFNAMRPRYSVAPDHVAATAVISALAAVARWEDAVALFDKNHRRYPGDAVMLSATAAACRNVWEVSFALLQIGVSARLLTPALCGTSLTACASPSLWPKAAALLALMEQQSVEVGEASLAAAANAFSMSSCWREALELLVPWFSVAGGAALWGAAITAASRGHHWAQALSLLGRMKDALVEANEACSSSAMAGCVRASRWDLAFALWPEPNTGAVLAACQHAALWEQALHVIRQAYLGGQRGVVLRASAIAACAEAFQWSWALRLLSPLSARDPLPNAVCFGAALQACRRSSPPRFGAPVGTRAVAPGGRDAPPWSSPGLGGPHRRPRSLRKESWTLDPNSPEFTCSRSLACQRLFEHRWDRRGGAESFEV